MAVTAAVLFEMVRDRVSQRLLLLLLYKRGSLNLSQKWRLSLPGPGLAQKSGVLRLPLDPRAGIPLCADLLLVRRPAESPALHPPERAVPPEERRRQPVRR